MNNVLDMSAKPENQQDQEIQAACRQFFESNNTLDGFAEMLAASDSEILGADANHRAADLMRLNHELVKKVLDASCHLMNLLDDRIARQESRS